jgi:hypothetical protein
MANANDLIYSRRNADGTAFVEKTLIPIPNYFVICGPCGDLTTLTGSFGSGGGTSLGTGSTYPFTASWSEQATWASSSLSASYSYSSSYALSASWAPSGGGDTVKISATDTTADYLGTKLVAGSNVTLTVLSSGGNETLQVASTGGGGETTYQSDPSRAVISDNLLTNPNFTSDLSGWEYDAAGWEWGGSSNWAKHIVGSTTPLSQSVFIHPNIGYRFYTRIRFSDGSGSATLRIGTQVLGSISKDQIDINYVVYPTQTGSLKYSITPTSNFSCDILQTAVEAITSSNLALPIFDQNMTSSTVLYGISNNNIAIGSGSLINLGVYANEWDGNVAIGYEAGKTILYGQGSVLVGYKAG